MMLLHNMNLFVSDFVKQINLKSINMLCLHWMLVLCSHLHWCEMGVLQIEKSAVGLWVIGCICHFTPEYTMEQGFQWYNAILYWNLKININTTSKSICITFVEVFIYFVRSVYILINPSIQCGWSWISGQYLFFMIRWCNIFLVMSPISPMLLFSCIMRPH